MNKTNGGHIDGQGIPVLKRFFSPKTKHLRVILVHPKVDYLKRELVRHNSIPYSSKGRGGHFGLGSQRCPTTPSYTFTLCFLILEMLQICMNYKPSLLAVISIIEVSIFFNRAYELD